MKKLLIGLLAFMLVLTLAGCGAKEPAANEANGGTVSGEPEQSQTAGDPQKPQNETTASSKTLPDSYPKEILPLAADAEILDVRENPANNGLEVSYVSSNDIDTLCDFYEGALKDAEGLSTAETQDGYMITAKMDGVGYTIMLSKDAMKSNPQYAGKISVYIVLIGLKDVSDGESQMPEGEGGAQNSDTASTSDKWPTHGAAANIPELGEYSELKVTDMNTLGSDEFIIECKTSKEDLREYAESVMEKFPLKRTKIDEGGMYSVTGRDNKGLVFTAQHDSSTNVAKIQIYVDSFFDPENPDGTDENDVPNWVNKP